MLRFRACFTNRETNKHHMLNIDAFDYAGALTKALLLVDPDKGIFLPGWTLATVYEFNAETK